MKMLIIGSLLSAGVLLANDQVEVNRLSYFERYGLETQSPRFDAKGMDKHKKVDNEGIAKQKTKPGYYATSNKTTVNAFIPYGK